MNLKICPLLPLLQCLFGRIVVLIDEIHSCPFDNAGSKLISKHTHIHPCTMIYILLPGGLPIALFPDGEDLSASGSGTPSEDDEVEGGDDDASNGSWEDIEEEEV